MLLREALELLAPEPGDVAVDLTLGGGGYARAFLDRVGPTGRVIGIDQDDEALQEASRRLAGSPNFLAVKGNFRDLGELLDRCEVGEANRMILDLGVSSHQLDRAERGFSFRQDAPLDMRMDQSQSETAADLVGELEHGELARVIREYGEERFASRIASAIVRARQRRPIETTAQLAEVVEGAVPAAARHGKIHPATRTFQALRIAVNDELESLREGLVQALERLARGGRIGVIAYHSLEDRIVKDTFSRYGGLCVCPREFPVCRCQPIRWVRSVTGKPVRPGSQEVDENPRSRSARLRVAERI